MSFARASRMISVSHGSSKTTRSRVNTLFICTDCRPQPFTRPDDSGCLGISFNDHRCLAPTPRKPHPLNWMWPGTGALNVPKVISSAATVENLRSGPCFSKMGILSGSLWPQQGWPGLLAPHALTHPSHCTAAFALGCLLRACWQAGRNT